eukprot:TRINITY_DN4824_c0_g1_i1.p1 TRINITY_DN4824_c0_g1~~TRINITY_DN4824_c0_g1_i1.p1  ORF type:complete len:279 (+),score=42.62 TRINITY_DN4824_c0_g1_i1:66-902(+)
MVRRRTKLLPATVLLVLTLRLSSPNLFVALPAARKKVSSGRVARQPRVGLLPKGPFEDNLIIQRANREGTATQASGSQTEASASAASSSSSSSSSRSRVVQAWGALGVCSYLGYGVQKVVPIVMEGLGAIDQTWQWGLLAVTLLFFAYVEGYKGFQLGFSPRVVSRAWVVSEDAEGAPFWHKVLAPAFCIGYFHGTKKRVITSWAVTSVIFAVVVGVKQLANPYRAIIDAGVIVGLMWGIVSIIVLFIQSLQTEKPPEFDPALPEDTPYTPPPNIPSK